MKWNSTQTMSMDVSNMLWKGKPWKTTNFMSFHPMPLLSSKLYHINHRSNFNAPLNLEKLWLTMLILNIWWTHENVIAQVSLSLIMKCLLKCHLSRPPNINVDMDGDCRQKTKQRENKSVWKGNSCEIELAQSSKSKKNISSLLFPKWHKM